MKQFFFSALLLTCLCGTQYAAHKAQVKAEVLHTFMPKPKFNKPVFTDLSLLNNDQENTQVNGCVSDLWYFMQQDFTELAERLITSRAADIYEKNREGETPLCHAIKKKNATLVRCLVHAGAFDTKEARDAATQQIAALVDEEQRYALQHVVEKAFSEHLLQLQEAERKEKAAEFYE